MMLAMSNVVPLPTSGLSERDMAILEFESSWWEAPGSKDVEIRQRFQLSAPRYYQELNRLIDDPDALAYKPLLVKRLRRQRAKRQQQRSARHLTITASS